MPHNIHVPATWSKQLRYPDIDADIEITCFPNDYVEYSLAVIRVAPGHIFQITAQAVFFREGRKTNLSQMATFFTNKNGVDGDPPGPRPRTGRSMPSASSISGVDDFEIMSSCGLRKNL